MGLKKNRQEKSVTYMLITVADIKNICLVELIAKWLQQRK